MKRMILRIVLISAFLIFEIRGTIEKDVSKKKMELASNATGEPKNFDVKREIKMKNLYSLQSGISNRHTRQAFSPYWNVPLGYPHNSFQPPPPPPINPEADAAPVPNTPFTPNFFHQTPFGQPPPSCPSPGGGPFSPSPQFPPGNLPPPSNTFPPEFPPEQAFPHPPPCPSPGGGSFPASPQFPPGNSPPPSNPFPSEYPPEQAYPRSPPGPPQPACPPPSQCPPPPSCPPSPSVPFPSSCPPPRRCPPPPPAYLPQESCPPPPACPPPPECPPFTSRSLLPASPLSGPNLPLGSNECETDEFNNCIDSNDTDDDDSDSNSGVFKKEEHSKVGAKKKIGSSGKSGNAKCKLLVPEKLVLEECFSPSNETTECSKVFETNSRVLFDCKYSVYARSEEPKYTEITCKNGKWNRPIVDDFCEAKCGTSAEDLYIPPKSHSIDGDGGEGMTTDVRDYPWHVGIYEIDPKTLQYKYICGGTLISRKVILSAAHCFFVENEAERTIDLKNLSTLIVALGKTYRNLTEFERFTQVKEIFDIEIPQEYDGRWSRYAGDIAFIELKEKVECSWEVQPICIDLNDENFERDQLKKHAVGKMVSLGLTTKDGALNEKFVHTEMSFIPRKDCIKNMDTKWRDYLSKDKLCAELKDEKFYICDGDSGGGLVFRDENSKRHYLRGVLSAGSNECKDEKGFALFTDLSLYKELMEKYIQLE